MIRRLFVYLREDRIKAIELWLKYSVSLFVQTIYNEQGEERWEKNNDGRRSEKQKSFCRFFNRQLQLGNCMWRTLY